MRVFSEKQEPKF